MMTTKNKEHKWFYSDEHQITKKTDRNDRFCMTEIIFLNEEIGYLLREGIVDLTEYTKKETLSYISAYGYDSIEEVKEAYKEEWQQIVAECIFEIFDDFNTGVYFKENIIEEYLEKIVNEN